MTNITRRPDARNRAIASGAPGIAWRDSQTTPSRSHSTNRTADQSWFDRPRRGVARVRCSKRTPPANLFVCRGSNRSPPSATPRPTSTPLIAPPYDVLSDADLDELEARDPHNIVHVDVPRERDGAGRYDAAAERLRSWIADGVMVRDGEPSFTLYRMRFTDEAGRGREIVGVMGALEVVDEGAGGVLPHERTTPKASTDRLDLTRATEANLSPVWGLSLAAGSRRCSRPRASRSGRSPSTASSTASSASPTPTGSPTSRARVAATTC